MFWWYFIQLVGLEPMLKFQAWWILLVISVPGTGCSRNIIIWALSRKPLHLHKLKCVCIKVIRVTYRKLETLDSFLIQINGEPFLYLWIGRQLFLPKLIYRFIALPIVIPANHFLDIDKEILKFYNKAKYPE